MGAYFKFTNIKLLHHTHNMYDSVHVFSVREMIVPISQIRSIYVAQSTDKKDVYRADICMNYHHDYDEIRITKEDYNSLKEILEKAGDKV